MLDRLFPTMLVKVVGKTPNHSWCGLSDYCIENEKGERTIVHYSDVWAEIGHEIRMRNYWLFWA